jgi:hypothetical protein
VWREQARHLPHTLDFGRKAKPKNIYIYILGEKINILNKTLVTYGLNIM